MTQDQTGQVIAVVRALWPHSELGGDTDATLGAWHGLLGELPFEAVQASIMRLAKAGREHAPPPGVVARDVAIAAAAPAPGFDEVQAYLSRNTRLLPYAGDDRDTLEAVVSLTRAGAHEAVCRWVAEVGLYAARMTPDPTLQPLDPNQLADRRDRARSYERRTVPAWEADPTPGLAVELVRRKAAHVEQRDQARIERAQRRRLEAVPEPAVDPTDLTGREAIAQFQRRLAEGRLRAARAHAEVEAERRADDEARAEAEAELRDLGDRRQGGGDA